MIPNRTVLTSKERFGEIDFKHYDAPKPRKVAPHLALAERAVEQIKEKDLGQFTLGDLGVLVRTEGFMNFRIWVNEHPPLSFGFLFGQSLPKQPLTELDMNAEGVQCDTEGMLFGWECQLHQKLVDSEIDRETYLTTFMGGRR